MITHLTLIGNDMILGNKKKKKELESVLQKFGQFPIVLDKIIEILKKDQIEGNQIEK
jgi:hypothetical protein